MSENKERMLIDLENIIDASWNIGKKAGWGGSMATRNKTDKKKIEDALSRILKTETGELTEAHQEWIKTIIDKFY